MLVSPNSIESYFSLLPPKSLKMAESRQQWERKDRDDLFKTSLSNLCIFLFYYFSKLHKSDLYLNQLVFSLNEDMQSWLTKQIRALISGTKELWLSGYPVSTLHKAEVQITHVFTDTVCCEVRLSVCLEDNISFCSLKSAFP